MNENDEEINNEKNIDSFNLQIPNKHLNVGFITTPDEDIKIIPKSRKKEKTAESEKGAHLNYLDYTSDIILTEDKVVEYMCFLRHNYILHKFIFDKDLNRIANLLECIDIYK